MGDLEREARGLAEPVRSDVALDGVATGAQLVPVVGGFFGSVLDRVVRKRAMRQQAFWERIGRAVDELDGRLDVEFVASDGFDELVEDVLERLQSRQEMEKRDYYAAAITNAATGAWPDGVERARFMATLGDLRLSHLLLLATVERTTDGAPAEVSMGGVEVTLQAVLPGADLAQVRLDWGDLTRAGLLQSYPSGTMSRQGMTNLRVRLTELGLCFAEFIREPGQGQ